MAVTVQVIKNEIENNGSEKKCNAILSLTGNYDQTTGVVIKAADLGLSFINRAVVGFDSTYVIKSSTSSDKKTIVIRLYDSALFTGPSMVYNANVFPGPSPDSTARLYIDTIVGGPFTIGETVTGAPSGASATVVSQDTDIHGNDRLEIGAPGAGAFTKADTITGGLSGATANATDETHITWNIQGILAAPIDLVEGDAGGGYAPIDKSGSYSPTLTTNNYRYDPSSLGQKIETLESDAFSQVRSSGIQMYTGSFNTLQEVLTGFGVVGLGGMPIEVWGY